MERTSPAKATVIVASLFITGLCAGSVAGRAAAARAHDPYAPLDVISRTLTTIRADHVEDVPSEKLVDAALKGMVNELDRHSVWLSADAWKALSDETEGLGPGLGLEVRPDESGAVVIQAIMPDSPALRHGLAPGDRIVSLDGSPVEGLELDEVRAKLHGKAGSEATLVVERTGEALPIEVRAVRDVVHTPAVEAALLPGPVVYLRLSTFQHGSAADLQREYTAMAQVAGMPVLGLVLDLRDNTGGLLDEATAVSDLFLDDGDIVRTRGRSRKEEVYTATPGGLPSDLPVMVLINGMSASASEIVAASLQDRARATLVGEPSYGKGSVQQVFRYPDGSALKLTVSTYYTPSGAPVAPRQGRIPDVLVPWPHDPTAFDRLVDGLGEAQLDEAERDRLLSLVGQLSKPAPARPRLLWDLAPTRRAQVDPQLKEALRLLQP